MPSGRTGAITATDSASRLVVTASLRALTDRSADELVPHRVVDQGGIAGQAELAQDASAIRAHGAGAQSHFLRDFADLLARGEEPHDAIFAIGELLVERFLRIARAFRREDLG